MSRAGLVFLIFFSLINLVACAPVPERLSSLVERSDDYAHNFAIRSLGGFEDPTFFEREYIPELSVRGVDADVKSFFRREYDFDIFDERDFEDLEHDFVKRDTLVLERRSFFGKLFHKIGHAFKKVGQGIAHVAKKVASGVVHVAKKVGHFIKTTGAKIAKFGLKIVAAAASVASKVVKFIPGVGTAAGMALKGVAMGANKASDKIHANLGKLGKVDKALGHVVNPLGGATKHMGKGGKILGALF